MFSDSALSRQGGSAPPTALEVFIRQLRLSGVERSMYILGLVIGSQVQTQMSQQSSKWPQLQGADSPTLSVAGTSFKMMSREYMKAATLPN